MLKITDKLIKREAETINSLKFGEIFILLEGLPGTLPFVYVKLARRSSESGTDYLDVYSFNENTVRPLRKDLIAIPVNAELIITEPTQPLPH